MLFDPKRMAEPDVPKALPVALESVGFTVGGTTLIDGVSLTLDRGPRTVIMGPNGAGKSLLLRIIQGLIEPTEGRVSHAWAPPSAAVRKRIALVFQRPVLLRRSVAANLDHALKVYGVASADRPGRIGELLRMADLAAMADRPARVLSGGEQQRLALVRALAAHPELLLLDEPTASLDPRATHAIEGLIEGAHANGTKIVLVTHDRGQAKRLADEIVFLNAGRLCERSPAEEFFARPSSDEAAAYLEGRLLL